MGVLGLFAYLCLNSGQAKRFHSLKSAKLESLKNIFVLSSFSLRDLCNSCKIKIVLKLSGNYYKFFAMLSEMK